MRKEPGSGDDWSVELEQAEIGRLYDTVRRDLYAGRLAEAREAASRLLELQPNSTTAHELMGDVLVAQGRRKEAQDEYRRALDLEPANADAERKFAEGALVLSEAERARQLMVSGDLRELRGAVHKDPASAATRSLFFPGLGQLYNGEYEKGLAAVVVGMPLFGLAIWGIVAFISSQHPRTPVPMTATQAVLALLGLFGYGALLVWSTWDAWRSAKAEGGDKAAGTEVQ